MASGTGTIYRLYSLGTAAVGLPLNAGLAYLVVTHTPKQMRVYSRILLQTIFIDTLTLIVFAVDEPVISI